MQELEVKTYNFTVDAIGLIKSLEKEHPELLNNDFKKYAGAVSLKFMDAVDSQENDHFANNLRDCLANSKKSLEILHKMQEIPNPVFENQKKTLIKDIELIIEKLDQINSKLIY